MVVFIWSFVLAFQLYSGFFFLCMIIIFFFFVCVSAVTFECRILILRRWTKPYTPHLSSTYIQNIVHIHYSLSDCFDASTSLTYTTLLRSVWRALVEQWSLCVSLSVLQLCSHIYSFVCLYVCNRCECECALYASSSSSSLLSSSSSSLCIVAVCLTRDFWTKQSNTFRVKIHFSVGFWTFSTVLGFCLSTRSSLKLQTFITFLRFHRRLHCKHYNSVFYFSMKIE